MAAIPAARVALVTGSTSGIGLEIARTLASRSCDLIITGALGNQQLISEVLQEFRSNYEVRVDYVEADLTKVSDVVNMIGEIEKLHPKGIDILINNAGVNHVGYVEEYPDKNWDEMIAVMLSAPFHLIKRTIPAMKNKGWGRIVNISSQMGIISVPKKAVYSAAKSGIIGLTKGVALELAGDGITCNAVCPGFARAPVLNRQIEAIAADTGASEEEVAATFASKTPTGSLVTTHQIAELVEFLCFSEASSNMTGACYLIDQGYTAQ